MIPVIITSIFLGIGLAMDACAVSMANGMKQPCMKLRKVLIISLMFGLFQGLMPLFGYLVGCKVLTKIEWIIPWAALGILGFLGIKMINDGIKDETQDECQDLTMKLIFIQAIATSIDALSVGIIMIDYDLVELIVALVLIGVITFAFSFLKPLFMASMLNIAESFIAFHVRNK